MIQITVQMSSYEEAKIEALAVFEQSDSDQREISDSSARAIAAQYQSSGKVGSVLASLASGLPVNSHDLYDDISNTFFLDCPVSEDNIVLGCLATWLLNHPSREA